MTLTIDTSISTSTANSYNEIAEIDLYAQAMSPSDAAAWLALATVDAKTPFAVRATRVLDTLRFPGYMTKLDQSLQWPRAQVPQPWGYNFFYDFTLIPRCVKESHAQLSVYLAANASTDPFAGADAGPLSELSVGPVDLKFRDPAYTDGAGRDYVEREIVPILFKGKCIESRLSVRLTR